MDFTLVDLEDEERVVGTDAWNWRPTLAAVRSFGVIDDDRLALMAFNGTEVAVSEAEAREIGARLRDEVLPRVGEGERLRLDLMVTADTGDEFYEEEMSRNYGATREWLAELVEFCLGCKGFEVV